MGTPDFAVPTLKSLYETENVTLVITQPNKPKGRGYELKPTAVKEYALCVNIPVIQPNTLKNDEPVNIIKEQNPDVIVVAAYGKILPESVLCIPKFGCINIHASLLPAYRGAAPINRVIMNGDKFGGITIMYMEKGLDTGDIILQKPINIPETMTAGEYHDIMSEIGANAITEVMTQIKNGTVKRTKQDDSKATYAAKIEKSESMIDFNKPAEQVANHIRGLSPFPGAFTCINGKRYKLFNATVTEGKGEPGCILSASCGCIEIACAEGSIKITEIQPECCKRMSVQAYLIGHKL
ncbi:MAG TPA: methionyl-tRNA formyltransferase [Clostridiales bacterium]|nr:methionyl-tRNA formyltransferase [Clostridiales bacterium]